MVTILQSPFVVELLLPFLLVFTVVFAILQKTKVLGDGKRQIDAIVSLVVGLIFVAFGQAVGFVINLIPIMAVVAIVFLVFMILYGMVFQGDDKFNMNKWLRGGFGVLAGIIVIVSVLVLTGVWTVIVDYYNTESSGLIANVVFGVVILIAILIVVFSGPKNDEDKDKGKDKE